MCTDAAGRRVEAKKVKKTVFAPAKLVATLFSAPSIALRHTPGSRQRTVIGT